MKLRRKNKFTWSVYFINEYKIIWRWVNIKIQKKVQNKDLDFVQVSWVIINLLHVKLNKRQTVITYTSF